MISAVMLDVSAVLSLSAVAKRRSSEIIADTEQTLYLRHLALAHLLDIRLGDAQFLRGDQREQGPAHDMRPLAVVLAYDRPDRLLRDDLGQDHVGVAAFELQAARGERGTVVGPGIAAALIVGVARAVYLLELISASL